MMDLIQLVINKKEKVYGLDFLYMMYFLGLLKYVKKGEIYQELMNTNKRK